MSCPRGLELLFNIEKRNFKSSTDCLAAVFHCFIINEGFQCVGVDEVWPDSEETMTEMLPKDWNKDQETYALRYVNKDRTNRVVLKMARVDHMLMINLGMNEKTISSVAHVSNYVNDGYEEYSTAYKNIESLAELFQENFIPTLLNKPKDSVEKESHDTSSSSTAPGPPPRPPRRLLGRPPPEPFRLPHVGGSDLDPFGGRGGGGMFVDPSDFGVPHRPTLPEFGVGGPGPGGLPRGAVPPGARFDPFMPPIIPRSGPDPDHFRPPDYDDFI